MGKIININIAEYAVGKNNLVIETSGIGSCLVICLYDADEKIGGMAHAMLPSRRKKNSVFNQGNTMIGKNNYKFVDEAIEGLIVEIRKIGGKKEKLKAKIIGGAEMFNIFKKKLTSIGKENERTAREKLEELGIPIDSEDVGGSVGRSVRFNLENGVVSIIVNM